MIPLNRGRFAPKKYFDLEAAVEEARRDYPEETRYTTFIDLDHPHADRHIAQWVESLDRDSKYAIYNSGDVDTLNAGNPGFTLPSPYGQEKLVAVHSRGNPAFPFFPNDRYKQGALAFYHELGHVVVKNGFLDWNRSVNKGENAADSFAILHGFRKGIFDKQDAKHVADMRLVEALSGGGFDHLTTMSLDALIINPKQVDFLSLTPKQVAKIARQHAEAFHNSPESESKLSAVFPKLTLFGREQPRPLLQTFARLALKEDEGSNEFYIASRVLLSAFKEVSPRVLVSELGIAPNQLKPLYDAIAKKTGSRDIGAENALNANPSLKTEKPGLGRRILNWFKPLSI